MLYVEYAPLSGRRYLMSGNDNCHEFSNATLRLRAKACAHSIYNIARFVLFKKTNYKCNTRSLISCVRP